MKFLRAVEWVEKLKASEFGWLWFPVLLTVLNVCLAVISVVLTLNG